MKSALFRNANQEDISALRSLWLKTWPEDRAYAECFFAQSFSPEDTYVAESNGKISGMFFSLKGYEFFIGDYSFPASYLYALAVEPTFRGQGIGRKLTAYAAAGDHRQGIQFVFLNPADDPLREWYKTSVNATDCFWQRRIEVSPNTKIPGDGILREITPETYSSLRTELLKGTDHMEIPLSALKLQADFCRISGGGLYRIDIGREYGICLGDVDDDHLTLRELLCPDIDPVIAAGCALKTLGCYSATVFTPVPWHTDLGSVEPTCVLIPDGSDTLPEISGYPHWGFLLD